MDFSVHLSTTSNQSSNSETKNENSMIVPAASKRAEFFNTYERQSFSLPSDSVIYYIAKNPTTSKLYKKMIQTCKYFFIKHPILVISGLRNYNNEWREDANLEKYDLNKFLCKFWINKRFYVGPKSVLVHQEMNPNLVSSITPKLYRCDITELKLVNQKISYSDLSLLISSAENITLNCVTVKYENGLNVPFEKIVEAAVNAKVIKMNKPTFTSETMKELVKIPHFSKIGYISLSPASEDFDIETFYSYIIMFNQKVWLHFVNPISDAYNSRLYAVFDKIITTETRGYKTPLILYIGQDWEKKEKLFDYWCKL